VKRVLQEALLVGVVGGAFAFVANGLSPRGLYLAKNYFPATGGKSSLAQGTDKANSTAEGMAERFEKEGLQLADSSRTQQLFADSRRPFSDPSQAEGSVVFIDARNKEHYAEGHIPGAYRFDRFHAENYLAEVVPVCQNAQQIVFYCSGGDCEDSEHAAIYLRDGIGLPKEKVFVYAGGITEWRSNGMPVESGARNSGQITNAAPQKAAK
jgi:rhodanese-related sulfurtransferase